MMDSTSQSFSANNSVSNLKLQDEEPTLKDNWELLDVSQLPLSDKTIDLKEDEGKEQPSQVEEEKELPKTMHPDFKEDEDKKQPSQAEKLNSSDKEELAKTMDEQMSSRRAQTLEESSQIEKGMYQILKYGDNNFKILLPLKEKLSRLQLCAICEEDTNSQARLILNYEEKYYLEIEESSCIPDIPGKYVAVFSSHKRFNHPERIRAHLQLLDGHPNALSDFEKELGFILEREKCSLNYLIRLPSTDELFQKLSEKEIKLIEDYKEIKKDNTNNQNDKTDVALSKLFSLLDPEMEDTARGFLGNQRDVDDLQLWATQQSEEIQQAVGEYIENLNAV